MANLNFQQPPRSIASSVLNNSRQSINGGNAIGNSAGAAGFVIGNSLSGHVTPTTGMFSQNSNNLAGANSIGGGGGGGNNTNNSFNSNNMPAQLSPNRSVQMPPGGGVGNIGGGLGLSVGGGLGQGNMGPAQQMSQRTSIFGQRTNFSDRRPIQGLGTMVSVVFSLISNANREPQRPHKTCSNWNSSKTWARSCSREAMGRKAAAEAVSTTFTRCLASAMISVRRCSICPNSRRSRTRAATTRCHNSQTLCNRPAANPTVGVVRT